MHRPFGRGGVSNAAADPGRRHGITVIDGGCPLMFDPTADSAHRAMRFLFTRNGNVPKRVRLDPRIPSPKEGRCESRTCTS